MSHWRLSVMLTAGLGVASFAIGAAPLPSRARFPAMKTNATPGLARTDQLPPNRVRLITRSNALSSSEDWIFNYGDLSLSDGSCENRTGRDSRMHFVTILPNDCEFTLGAALLEGAGDRTQSFAVHFGATGPKDDLDESGYGVIVQRSAVLLLVKASGGRMDVIESAPLGALGAAPRQLKIVRNGDQLQVFDDGVLKISVSDGTYAGSGYLNLRTTKYDELSGGVARWRFDGLSFSCAKR